MRWIQFLLSAICIIAFASADEKVSYDGFKVFRVYPKTEDQLKFLAELETDVTDIDFWTSARMNGPVDIMVSPRIQQSFLYSMAVMGLTPEIYIDDMTKLMVPSIHTKNENASFSWTKYYELEDINDWIDSLAVKYPKQVTVSSIGNSYENRTIKAVKISNGKSDKVVAIEGGIHAREWISPATVTYIINEILNGTDPVWRNISQNYDWYFIPVANPDGYEYTHRTDRMWRKTRTPYTTSCFGADPNRNFDVFWGTGGTSTSPCSSTYGGPTPFSEKETQAISKFITSLSKNLKVFLSFHSYSQLLLLPYGHTSAHLDNYEDAMAVGRKTISALWKRYGTKYEVGNVAEILYLASGTTADWVKNSTRVPLSYTYELRDTGKYGFLLPESDIIPNNLEIIDSLVALFQTAEEMNLLD